MENIIDLKQVQNINSKIFQKPTKYNHLGVKFSTEPQWIDFNKITRSDREGINSGRESQHTPEEKKTLQDSFASGVQLWQELPIVSKSIDKFIKKNKPYKLEAGFGRDTAIASNGLTGYWHWVVSGEPTQIKDMAAFENTHRLLDTEYQTGERGVEFHLKNLLSSHALDNDELEIEKKLNEIWPKLNNKSKQRIIKKVKDQRTKPRQFQTFNVDEVKTWLSETAAVSFVTNGNWDKDRGKIGYAAINMLDPWINACMQYAKTGKKSYVVMTVKSPTKRSTLSDKRHAHIDKLNEYKTSFKKLGMNVMPLEILGFMPQDNINEDVRHLVNANGKTIYFNK